MYQRVTKLLLAGAVSVALLATASTAIIAPAKAQGPPAQAGGHGSTLGNLACAVDEIAKFDGADWVCTVDASAADCSAGEYLDGDGSCTAVSTITPDTDTLDSIACTVGEIAEYDGASWVCSDALTDLTGALDRLADLEDLAPRYVFVTSSLHDGDLKTAGGGADGLDGADLICQGLADSVNAIVPVGTYKAWLSTDAVDAKDRIDITSGPYFRSDGTVVANNGADLLDGTLDLPIQLDELGNNIGAVRVWTGTAVNGEKFAGQNCGGWEEDSLVTGLRGLSSSTVADWTLAAFNNCSSLVGVPDPRLYCFQVLGGE